MNIEKIKNYNQKLLAVIGTVVVLFAMVGLVFFAVFAITEIIQNASYREKNEGILSDEKIEKLQKDNKRLQLVSYDYPKLIDTLNLVYMIPVAHKDLNNPQTIDEGLLGLFDQHSSIQIDSRYSRQNYGGFNNLLIYDAKNEQVSKLFEERVNFKEVEPVIFKEDILIILRATTKDTYKDGVINQLDYRSLFLYSLKSKTLKEISLDSADVFNIDFVENTKDLLIEFGIDYNKDGKYDEFKEPSIIKRYDYESGILKNIISEKLNRELQMKLEGTIQ